MFLIILTVLMDHFLLQLYYNDNCYVRSHKKHNDVPEADMPSSYIFYFIFLVEGPDDGLN
jgi:hypothetical protein